jgi:hypothetical protein
MATDISATPSTANRAAWRVALRLAYPDKVARYREYRVQQMVRDAYRVDPNKSPEDMAAAVIKFRNDFDDRVVEGKNAKYTAGAETHRTVLFGLQALEALSVGVSVGGEVGINPGTFLKAVYNYAVSDPRVQRTVRDWTREWANEAQWEAVAKLDEKEFDAVALKNSAATGNYAEALDRIYVNTNLNRLSRAETDQPADALEPVISQLPPAPAAVIRAAALDAASTGTFVMPRADLLDMALDHEALDGVLSSTMQATLAQIDRKQDDILAWQQAYDDRLVQQERRAAESLAHQMVVEGTAATVGVVSELLSLGDPRLGRQVRVVGDSVLQVYQAVEQFGDTMTQFSEAAKIGAEIGNLAVGMTGAVLTGNILGAVMNVVSLLAEPGPTPEQLILDEVGKLQDQVARLHGAMEERFDRIEKYLDVIQGGLNSIYDLLNGRLDQIQRDVASVQRDADLIQAELSAQRLLLDRVAQSVHAGMRDGFRHDFNLAYNALGYTARAGHSMSAQQFDGWENEFFTWAVTEAGNDLEQPVTGRSLLDEHLLEELRGHPIEQNVGFLSTWLSRRLGLDALGEAEIPNPVTWSASAYGYLQLSAENPEYANSAGYPARRAEVVKKGMDLADALSRITTLASGAPNHALFDWLTVNCIAKIGEMCRQIAAIEVDQLQDWSKVDPWAGTNQPIDHYPALEAYSPAIIATKIPAVFRLADYLELSEAGFSVELQPKWLSPPTRSEVLRGNPYTFTNYFSTLRVTCQVNYDGRPVFARYVDSAELLSETTTRDNRREKDPVDDKVLPEEALENNWLGGQKLKQKFENASVDLPLATAPEDIAPRVAAKLRELRATAYSAVDTELQHGQSLEQSNVLLDGAKALVQSWISLGLPLALESDDFLRALLFGEQSLVDSDQLRGLYRSAYVDASPAGSDELGSDNLRCVVEDDATARAEALRALLHEYLDLIADNTHGEGHPLVASMLTKAAATSMALNALATLAGVAVQINNGATHTSQTDVTLHLNPENYIPDGDTLETRLSNDGTSWTSWEPFTPRRRWSLASGDGAKTVWVEIRERASGLVRRGLGRVMVDTNAPRITSLKPPAGAATKDRTPTIGATIQDNSGPVPRAKVRLDLDRVRRSDFTYNRATGRVRLEPTEDLAFGRHSVAITVTDKAGNRTRKQWIFRIV